MHDLNHILSDRELVDQLLARLEDAEQSESLGGLDVPLDPLKTAVETLAAGRACDVTTGQEAIIRQYGRPVLYIQDDAIRMTDVLPLWHDRLTRARAVLERVIPSVGRIELRGHPRFAWVGTGWLVAPNVAVTNRHVAEEFARQNGDAFNFRPDPVGRRMRARIDMYREYARAHESEFEVRAVLHIEPDEGLDVALLQLATRDQDDRALPAPIPLAAADAKPRDLVGAIGYAAWDGERNAAAVMDRIFEGVYDVKRLHPGEIMAVEPEYANHDCSTLGGNSGSAVIDFTTGHAVALHFAGRYEARNYAVKASALRALLERQGIDLARGV